MVDVTIYIEGFAQAEAAIRQLSSPSALNRLIGPALRRQAAVVRKFARKFNRSEGGIPDFTDRSGRLRKTIRTRSLPAQYGGRVYKKGGAQIRAGGKGARQAYLVHAGHGGPRPARPYPFLRQALLKTMPLQGKAFVASILKDFPKIAAAAARARASGATQSVYARVVSRRGRRR